MMSVIGRRSRVLYACVRSFAPVNSLLSNCSGCVQFMRRAVYLPSTVLSNGWLSRVSLVNIRSASSSSCVHHLDAYISIHKLRSLSGSITSWHVSKKICYLATDIETWACSACFWTYICFISRTNMLVIYLMQQETCCQFQLHGFGRRNIGYIFGKDSREVARRAVRRREWVMKSIRQPPVHAQAMKCNMSISYTLWYNGDTLIV
jgi:hypothetical protein